MNFDQKNNEKTHSGKVSITNKINYGRLTSLMKERKYRDLIENSEVLEAANLFTEELTQIISKLKSTISIRNKQNQRQYMKKKFSKRNKKTTKNKYKKYINQFKTNYNPVHKSIQQQKMIINNLGNVFKF